MIKFSRKRKLPTKPIPFVKLVPNIVTLLGLIIGVNSIRFAISQQWEKALYCILVATIIDGVDGRLARLLNASSRFGAELDSLCDFVNFGLCPALILYLWSLELHHVHITSWGCSMFFMVCMVIRLARFNTMIDAKASAESDSFFQGVPAPSGAILALMPIIVTFDLLEIDYRTISPLIVNLYLIAISLLVASRIPTISFKKFYISPRYLSLVLMVFALTIIYTYIYTWHIIPVIAIIYLLSIPVCILKLRRMKRDGL